MTVFGLFPNQNVFFDDGLSSPLMKEFTLSGGATLGSRGHTRVSYLHRRTSDVVEDFFNLAGGATTIAAEGQEFGRFENQIFRKTDQLHRNYDAMLFQGQYRVADNFILNGSWAVQLSNEGNFEGESPNQPAIASPAFDYPEITPEVRYYPTGRLDEFQRHKARIWGIYNVRVGRSSTLDIGGMWRHNSGRSYSIVATRQGQSDIQAGILDSLGYAGSPDPRTLFFNSGRGSETFEGYGLFDLSLQYSIPVWESLRPWVKAEIFNVFNSDKQISWNTSVTPDPDSAVDELGLPTGYVEGPRFGQATSSDNYPQWSSGLDGLRTIRFALGFRF